MKIQSLTNTRLVLALLAAGVVGGAGVTVVSAQRADGTSAPFVASAMRHLLLHRWHLWPP